ncbi:MAG TPA: response regulator transcription factor [Verrucomicrobiae bacterium]|nr:response regulator transcription factor [Verrucomicrobiae bacterium]
MNPIRVLLADDHLILLEALKKLVEQTCQVVGTATDGHSLMASAEKLHPDVIVTDINMPNLNGLEACERLIKKAPDSRIIFLTVNEDLDTAKEAMRRGAFGYLLKKGAFAELLKAVQTVAAGRLYVTPMVSRDPVSVFVSMAKSSVREEPLTARQREVLQLLAEGKSMKEAADLLNVSPRTIAFHKYTMMGRLEITRNSELVRYATQSGLCAAASRI